MTTRIMTFIMATMLVFWAPTSISEEKKITVTDSKGKSHTVTQKTQRIGNNKRIIIPGKRSEKLKSIHKDICNSMGGKDITDQGITTLSGSAVDAVTCHIPKSNSKKRNKNKTIDKQSFLFPPALDIYPPHGTVQTGERFRVNGYFKYATDEGGRFNSKMTADGCGASKGGMAPADAEGEIAMSVLCQAFESGSYTTSLKACIPGLCASGKGLITAQ